MRHDFGDEPLLCCVHLRPCWWCGRCYRWFTEEQREGECEVIHHLKIWPEFFDAVESGDKTAEYRADTHNIRVGDTVWLEEYEPKGDKYTGRKVRVTVTHVGLHTHGVGIPIGFCVLSVKLAPI